MDGLFRVDGSRSRAEEIEDAISRDRLPEMIVQMRDRPEDLLALASTVHYLLQENKSPLVPYAVFEEMMRAVEGMFSLCPALRRA